MRRGTPILWDVMEEHLDEAAFLWQAWERALASPSFTLGLVASGPEERLLAHLDALVLGGEVASRRLLEPALGGDDPGRAFAAAWALLEAGGEARVIRALGAADGAPRGGIRRALELTGRPVEAALLALAGEGPAGARAAALEALAFRGADPGELLRAAVAAKDPAVRAAAMRAARRSRAAFVPGAVLAELSTPEAPVREAAIETGLVLGLREAWSACARFAAADPPSGRLMLLLALGGDEAEREPLLAAAAMPGPSREALFGLGFAGRVADADACLEATKSQDPATARIAGEAFSAITGLAIAPPYEAVEAPEAEEPIPFEREELEADLAAGPEPDLPLPDALGLESWWSRARPGLDPAARYLGGKPRDAEGVAAALAGGPMRRRHALALELEIRSKGALRLGTRRWAREQRLPAEGLRSIDLGRPFKALVKGV